MCFSIDSPDSLENNRESGRPDVCHFCPCVPVILAWNKKGLRNDPRALPEPVKTKPKPMPPGEECIVAEATCCEKKQKKQKKKTVQGSSAPTEELPQRAASRKLLVTDADRVGWKTCLLIVSSKDQFPETAVAAYCIAATELDGS
ncbi:ras-like GTP-binding protein Rho1 [Dermacentor albipictus]|uniref:ras-like GTP-binding protein Rho1 n=1 Tax=Dermacentor albipictus TaxID=60249 RepID=UPI0038FC1262